MDDKKIVFLWAEITAYIYSTMTQLNNISNYKIFAIHWGLKNINSNKFIIPDSENIVVYEKKLIFQNNIFNFLNRVRPDLIVISAWMDNDYITACREYKRKFPNVIVVSGLDGQWKGSFRQYLGSIYFKISLKKIIDYLWVSGPPQFAFALHLGYNLNNIISNLYSADSTLFISRKKFIKRFIFVGRFVNVKNIDGLIYAYNQLDEKTQREWPLFLIGDGDQYLFLKSQTNPYIHVLPFMQSTDLSKFLLDGGVGILPSIKEPWGVVVHEFTSAGLPLILSSSCGSATEFLITGFNGFMFENGNVESLLKTLLKTINLSNSELKQFSNNSLELSKKINPTLSAYSLLSCFHKKSMVQGPKCNCQKV